jgi:hypothetical protein
MVASCSASGYFAITRASLLPLFAIAYASSRIFIKCTCLVIYLAGLCSFFLICPGSFFILILFATGPRITGLSLVQCFFGANILFKHDKIRSMIIKTFGAFRQYFVFLVAGGGRHIHTSNERCTEMPKKSAQTTYTVVLA